MILKEVINVKENFMGFRAKILFLQTCKQSVKVCKWRLQRFYIVNTKAFVYKIAMSVLIEFVEWVKAEAEKSDDLIMEDALIIGNEKISALLEAYTEQSSYRVWIRQ